MCNSCKCIPPKKRTWNVSKAFRCHQVLLNHAKQKRKGTVFISPNKKMELKAKKTLSLHVCVALGCVGDWTINVPLIYNMHAVFTFDPFASIETKEGFIIWIFGGYCGDTAHWSWHTGVWSWRYVSRITYEHHVEPFGTCWKAQVSANKTLISKCMMCFFLSFLCGKNP